VRSTGETSSWKQQQHLQLTARKKPFSDLTGHDKQANVVLVCTVCWYWKEHTSRVSPEAPASYPPTISLGPNIINLISRFAPISYTSQKSASGPIST